MAENVVFNNQNETGEENANTPNNSSQNSGNLVQQSAGGDGEIPPEGPVEEGVEEVYQEEAPLGFFEKIKRIITGSGDSNAENGEGGKKGKLKLILIIAGVILILLILLFIFLPKNQKTRDVTLVWWGLWEDNSTMQPIIDAFEKENPHIKINYIKQDPQKYRETLLTRINNGSGPDIFRYHNTWTPAITSVLAPLPKDVITLEDFSKQYYPVMQNDLIKNGAIYGIPIGADTLALFINTDLLSSANLTVPRDWNQFISAAKQLTQKDPDTKEIKVAGAALGTYGNITHAADILSVMFLQQNVSLTKITEENDNLVAAIKFYASFSRGADAVWDKSLDNSQLAFAKGQLAMYFGFSWDIFTIEQLRAGNKFNYTINPVPSLAGGKSISVASYWAEGVSSRGKNQREAMIFMKYLTQKDTLERFYTQGSKTRPFGEPYPRADMASELSGNPLVYPFISQLDSAGSSYFASNTSDGDTGLNSRANAYLENALNSVSANYSSADTVIKDLKTGVGKVLVENGIQ